MAVVTTEKLCIFGGTTEGRILAERLAGAGYPVTLCVATEVGSEQISETEKLTLHEGRLDASAMEKLLSSEGFSRVIDATHPYAVVVTETIQAVCRTLAIPYQRLHRPSSDYEGCIVVGSKEEAIQKLNETTGNILLTVGAKELSAYTVIKDYEKRCYPRVLPMLESLQACHALGFPTAHIIAMQGPFTKSMNRGLIEQYGIEAMLTKDSGTAGGFREKISAALEMGVKVVVVARPKEDEGFSLEMLLSQFLGEEQGISPDAKASVTIVGVGTGAPSQITLQGKTAIDNADLVIGSERLLKTFGQGKPQLKTFRGEEMAVYLEANPQYQNVVVLMSGDIGFYSGAKKLYDTLSDYKLETISGISSVVYFCGKLKTSWDDLRLCSLHGRCQDVLTALKESSKVFTLLGGEMTVKRLCDHLVEEGMGEAVVTIGERLSYPDERITTFRAKEMPSQIFDSLSVALIGKDTGE